MARASQPGGASRRRNDITPASQPFALYSTADVAAAMGHAAPHPTSPEATSVDVDWVQDGDESAWLAANGGAIDGTEHQARLRQILERGEAGRWREVVGPAKGAPEAIDLLTSRAPHFSELAALVRRHVDAAINMNLPLVLPAILLLGVPGVGKSWFLTRLAALLGVPFRIHAMNGTSLSDGIQGSHPVWRNARPGLVARTLTGEQIANPILFVDEFDKGQAYGHGADPYRPFYSALEPVGAARFEDEFYQFPLDASAISWVMAANNAEVLPAAILDRLMIVDVPEMTREQRLAVAASIYADLNRSKGGFFEGEPSSRVLEGLADTNPRGMRVALNDAMVRAGAAGHRAVRECDVRLRPREVKPRIGFR